MQAKLADRTSAGSAAGKHTRVALLAGMIRDDRGRPMSPTHTRNHGRRCTYYASNMNDDGSAPALRLPAGEIERTLRHELAKWFRCDANLRKLTATQSAEEKQRVFAVSREVAGTIDEAPIMEARALLEKLDLKVTVNGKAIKGSFNPSKALGIEQVEQTFREAAFEVPLDRRSYGVEPRLRLQPAQPDQPERDNHLVELLGRAFQARETLLAMCETETQSLKTTRLRHLQRLAKLSYLNPTTIRSILTGTQPKDLSSRSLWRMASLPIRWNEQREALGFQHS